MRCGGEKGEGKREKKVVDGGERERRKERQRQKLSQ
jgi:hypothetical protein